MIASGNASGVDPTHSTEAVACRAFQHETDLKPPREFGVVLGWRALIK